jgi:ABC-type uncharacterized transport system permease subunit
VPRLFEGSRVSIGVLLALLGVAAMWVFLFRTRAGFAQQVGGLAPAAARYAGFSSRQALWTALLISGGAAGLAGALEVAGPIGQLTPMCRPATALRPSSWRMWAAASGGHGVLGHPDEHVLYRRRAGAVAPGLDKSLTGVFQGLLLFSLLACDTLVNYRLRLAARGHADGIHALLVAATLNAGTVLALASLGLLINEKVGIVNLGAEGMMLCAALAGLPRWCTPATTGWALPPAWARGVAGIAVRRAGDLAQHQPVRHRAGTDLFGTGVLGVCRHQYVQAKLPEREVSSFPVLADIPLLGPALFRHHPLVYLTVLGTLALIWFMYRTRSRPGHAQVGESPESAHALGYPVRRIRLLAVVAGGALCGLSGAYLSVVYTPLWVEGMVSGKGWIALALTTFATWRPARVLLGAYLFGGVTMLQFHLQGIGVDIPSQFLSMLPYICHHRGAGADLAQPAVDPHQHARVAGQTVLSRLIMSVFSTPPSPRGPHDRPEQTIPAQAAALTAVTAAVPWWAAARRKSRLQARGRPRRRVGRAQARAAEDRVRLCRPGGRRWLDVRARQRAQGHREGVRRQGGDLLRRERARVGRRRARDPRHGRAGQQADLRHDLRLHGADAQGGRRQQGREVRARHRLQAGREHAHLRQPHLRRRVHGGRDRRQDDQVQHAGRGRLGADPRGDPQHQQLHAGCAVGNPKIKTKVVWVNEWFNPPKETEAATSLINGGADVLFQNTDSSAVLQTAEELGKRAFGWDSDMTAYGPKAHLGSAVINWAPYYIKATKDALDGKWKGGSGIWWGHKEGAIDMVSVAEDVPEDAKARSTRSRPA